MIKTYATLGPACCEVDTLSAMLRLGLTGFRLNLSHRTLSDCKAWTDALRAAGEAVGVRPELIIDLRGAELRLGSRNFKKAEGLAALPGVEKVDIVSYNGDTLL